MDHQVPFGQIRKGVDLPALLPLLFLLSLALPRGTEDIRIGDQGQPFLLTDHG